TDDTPRAAESMGIHVVHLPRRSGAAAARNAAAEFARGEILLFIDADVCVHPDTLSVAAASFDDPSVDAVFGSYDLEPAEPNLLSQYKNLAHRFYHQVSDERASTFWSGCGAIRREVFNQFKFDAQRFTRPSIEDIDLGARLTRAGKKIIINKNLQAKHLKHWTLLKIFRSDLIDRAIPWTRLILREEHLPGELNLSRGQRTAALLTALSAMIFLAACCFHPWMMLLPLVTFAAIAAADRWTNLRMLVAATMLVGLIVLIGILHWWAAAILVPIAIVVLINTPLYRFFLSHRGWLFTAAVLPMQLAYYLYSIGGFAVGHFLHFLDTTERLDHSANRVRFYVKLTIVLYALAWTLVLVRGHVRHTTVDFAVSDATGYYIYLPSVVIDHDLKFENQLADQFHSDETMYDANAMKHNRWPIGVALSIAPAFLVAHGLSLLLYHWTGSAMWMPNGYSPIYYILCVAWAMAIGTAGMICIDRLLVERFAIRGRIVAAAVLTTWLGTNFAWYFVREPLLAHMLGAAWVIFSVYLIHLIEMNCRVGRVIWWQLPLLAFVASMALVCRLTNAFMLPMFVYLLVVLIRQRLIPRAMKTLPLI
ncbi:MAG TPA: glycosyltransferase, partial [Tepidisphaeraceae bacterium]|nr:glycosyltransferase [Tepidisphaeraceae bacterium]